MRAWELQLSAPAPGLGAVSQSPAHLKYVIQETSRSSIRTYQKLTTFALIQAWLWNESTHLAQVIREMTYYNIELLISTGELLYSGIPENKSRKAEVGTILPKTTKICPIKWKPISKRISTVRMLTHTRNLTIVQCYTATEAALPVNKKTIYEQINSILWQVNKDDIVIAKGECSSV